MSVDNDQNDLIFGVSEFVAVFNQTLEYAYPTVNISGEIANFKISKNKWVYFDLKDDKASIKCFGSIYQLPGPLSDGLSVEIKGQPRLHPNFGFNISFLSIRPTGEGSIKKVADELKAKLATEGLFDTARKRQITFPPNKIGLITSEQSAAYGDFTDVINKKWVGLDIDLYDVQVQGISAPNQIISAINFFNQKNSDIDVLVIIRGGGSADDLQAYSVEQVVRTIASSRIPTLVAIGHEIDISLAEMVADLSAITPTNAAQLLVPDKINECEKLVLKSKQIRSEMINKVQTTKQANASLKDFIVQNMNSKISNCMQLLKTSELLLKALNPKLILKRGYAIIRDNNGKIVSKTKKLKLPQTLNLELSDGNLDVSVDKIK